MSDPSSSETPLRTTFKIRLNGDTLAIATVGQAYQFLTKLSSVEWMEHRALHNNAVESDIREFVKRRKLSGGTRNDAGRRCRDTFASLKKTCRKLGVRFWDYLQGRFDPPESAADHSPQRPTRACLLKNRQARIRIFHDKALKRNLKAGTRRP